MIADLHGDKTALENYVEYVNHYQAFIDMGICLGDTVCYFPTDDSSYYQRMIAKSKIPVLYTLGNHDVATTLSIDKEEAYEKYITPMLKNKWIEEEAMGEEKACYYYKDLESYPLRVISLMEFEATVAHEHSEGYEYKRYMSSKQLQWLADTLFDTPKEYAVCILLHQIPVISPDLLASSFTQSLEDTEFNTAFTEGFAHLQLALQGDPIGDIVHAFQTATKVEKEYLVEPEYSNILPCPKVAKDFTHREPGEFICFFTGHHHASFISTNPQYPNQLCITLPSASRSAYQRQNDDIKPMDATDQAFYFYCVGIRRKSKEIKLYHVGNTTTIHGKTREITTLSYDGV